METAYTESEKMIGALIIDDDIDTCVLLNRILHEKKINSLYVNTLLEAKILFETIYPSLIFLDNNLSDGYGLQFLPYIRNKLPESKVIFITAHSSDQNRMNALSNGAVFFISKPFSSSDIGNMIETLCY